MPVAALDMRKLSNGLQNAALKGDRMCVEKTLRLAVAVGVKTINLALSTKRKHKPARDLLKSVAKDLRTLLGAELWLNFGSKNTAHRDARVKWSGRSRAARAVPSGTDLIGRKYDDLQLAAKVLSAGWTLQQWKDWLAERKQCFHAGTMTQQHYQLCKHKFDIACACAEGSFLADERTLQEVVDAARLNNQTLANRVRHLCGEKLASQVRSFYAPLRLKG